MSVLFSNSTFKRELDLIKVKLNEVIGSKRSYNIRRVELYRLVWFIGTTYCDSMGLFMSIIVCTKITVILDIDQHT